MKRTIKLSKVRRQIAVALHVNVNEAQELVPMFVRKAA